MFFLRAFCRSLITNLKRFNGVLFSFAKKAFKYFIRSADLRSRYKDASSFYNVEALGNLSLMSWAVPVPWVVEETSSCVGNLAICTEGQLDGRTGTLLAAARWRRCIFVN